MDIEEKIKLIAKPPTEEIITEEDLRNLLETKEHPIAYNGFEPSGMMHLGTGLISGLKMMDFIKAGVHYKVLLADWHAFLNKKLDGDMKKIKQAAEYFKKGWAALGVKGVEYIYASDLIENPDYWEILMKISTKTKFKRIRRCLPIMGRLVDKYDGLAIAFFLYPLMQCADIFKLKVDITQLGLDQRNANMLAREIGPKIGYWKPIAVHHHLLMGLQKTERMGYDADQAIDSQISMKQSKSRPDSAIFIHDSPKEIKRKLKKAYCPEGQLKENPIIEIAKYIILRDKDSVLEIKRPAQYGGDISVTLPELMEQYKTKQIHPGDLKPAVADKISEILEPVRRYFKDHPEYLDLFKTTKITR
ncbi:MAG: tyrosine--tRNA ligase [Candidatus Helarchaeota archaeon]|nr:tyrosine--tRNA ligase [Candidatus Helarchaeota archaeon]